MSDEYNSDIDSNKWDRFSAVTFTDGFSLVKGMDCWIGSDSCEYDGPDEYLREGSPMPPWTKEETA